MEGNDNFLSLVSKMRREQEEYRIWLMEQAPEIILSRAAEWSAREDMHGSLDEWEPDAKTIEALLTCDKPLEKLFGWLTEQKEEDTIRKEIDEMAAGIVQMFASGC